MGGSYKCDMVHLGFLASSIEEEFHRSWTEQGLDWGREMYGGIRAVYETCAQQSERMFQAPSDVAGVAADLSFCMRHMNEAGEELAKEDRDIGRLVYALAWARSGLYFFERALKKSEAEVTSSQ